VLFPNATSDLIAGIAVPAVGSMFLNYKAIHAMLSGLSTVRRALKYSNR
jgi:hypothetical protein